MVSWRKGGTKLYTKLNLKVVNIHDTECENVKIEVSERSDIKNQIRFLCIERIKSDSYILIIVKFSNLQFNLK